MRRGKMGCDRYCQAAWGRGKGLKESNITDFAATHRYTEGYGGSVGSSVDIATCPESISQEFGYRVKKTKQATQHCQPWLGHFFGTKPGMLRDKRSENCEVCTRQQFLTSLAKRDIIAQGGGHGSVGIRKPPRRAESPPNEGCSSKFRHPSVASDLDSGQRQLRE